MRRALRQNRDWRSRAKELLKRLRGRPDSEHEMSFNRLAFTTIALIFVAVADLDRTAVPGLLAFCVLSAVMFVHVMLDDGVRVWRRIFMMLADVTAISYFIASNGSSSAGFWPLLLWTILGNGFRFGNAYLYVSTAACVLAFGIIIATTPFWQENMALAIGLLLGLIILPTFATKLIAKLSKAKQEAEEASRAKSYFLASVSHELRTPLTAIIGLGQHLESSDLQAEEKGMAGTIVTAGKSLLSLINQLLDFSRLGAKGIAVELGEFDLFELLSSVRELLKGGAHEKGLKLTLHVAAQTPLKLVGDEGHLRDVLVNLVGNALKFTEQGSITISADVEKQIDGSMKLLLAVTDTGIGIEPEAQAHIFESFRQADHTIIDRFGGTGLGLAICQQVAELLGGEIGVESTPGVGSRFWFTSKIQPIEESVTDTTERQGRFVLFSDDDATIAALTAATAGAGIRVEAAGRPETIYALAAAAPADDVVAIIIDHAQLDRGPETLTQIRDELGHGFKPILLHPRGDAAELDRSIERTFVTVISPRSPPAELRRALRLGAAIDPESSKTADDKLLVERQPRRILVADDNAMNRKVFSMILGRAGHGVELANDGEMALDVMKDHQLDIVLMDVNMPVLNGIEATKLYRFTALGRRRIPIVGITADASIETMERCLEAGMDACISKPVEAGPLLQLIDDIIEKVGSPPRVPAFDPTGVVTPLFPPAPDETPPISWEKLDDLEELGGPEFVDDLLTEYMSDSTNLLDEIRYAVAGGDVTGFRNGTHALRSSGANIGATKVAEMCIHLQRIERAEFDAKGARHLEALEAELDRVRTTLDQRDQRKPAVVRR